MPENLQQEIKQLSSIYEIVVEFFVNYSFQLVGAILILLLGFWVGTKAGNLVTRLCQRHNLDVTLSKFMANTSKFLIIAMMAVIALGKIGISIAPFVAAVGAISLGAGLAFQGLLSNYGAGLNLVITRPFVVGDTITVQGVTGVVREIRLAMTFLVTEDDVLIIVPNKHIVGEILHNSQADTLIELEVGISYHDDPERAIDTVRQTLLQLPELNSEHPPLVGIDRFGDSGIVIGVRCWAPTVQHYQARYAANRAVHAALKRAAITIPFPQREVRMLDDASSSSGA